MAKKDDIAVSEDGITSFAVKYGDSQLAVFHIPKRGFYATQQMCPHRQAFVLDHGIIGNTPTGDLVSDPFPLLVKDYIITYNGLITTVFPFIVCCVPYTSATSLSPKENA